MVATDARASGAPQASAQLKTKIRYLTFYNAVSAVAWAVILGRTVIICMNHGPADVYDGLGSLVKWTQTVACLEILHSVFGITRSPVATTALQVLARCAVLWGYVEQFSAVARTPGYTSMLLAWSVTEVVRYTYFVFVLNGSKPVTLVWLRYSMFYVLYPIGFLSECAMVYLAAVPMKEIGPWWPYLSYFCLSLYIPGSYMLYTYMGKQRRKVLGGGRAEAQDAHAAKRK